MEPAAWFTLVPLSVASLLTGIVQSLGSVWGLFRHYWVVFKLLINLGAIVVLLMYTQTLGYLARVAAEPTSSGDALRSPSVVLHTVLALLLLLAATVLAVYKPRGRTRTGAPSALDDRRQACGRVLAATAAAPCLLSR